MGGNRVLESVPISSFTGTLREPILVAKAIASLQIGTEAETKMRFWKIMLWFSIGGGCLFFVLAVLLATTLHSLDLMVHDRYFVILPSSLVLVSVLLFIATIILWKVKLSH